jgi:hypothetical protein
MKFPFLLEVAVEAEVVSVAPDGDGNIEVTLSANGREAKMRYDAAGKDHGTLRDALIWLAGYRREREIV